MMSVSMAYDVLDLNKLMLKVLEANSEEDIKALGLTKTEFNGVHHGIKWVVYCGKNGISIRVLKADGKIIAVEGAKGMSRVFFDIEDDEVVDVKFGVI